MALKAQDFSVGLRDLWAAFQIRHTTDKDRLVAINVIWNQIERLDWVDQDVWYAAIQTVIRTFNQLPTIRELIEALRDSHRAEKLAEEVRGAKLSHTVDPQLREYAVKSGAWDRGVASGSVRSSKRKQYAEQLYGQLRIQQPERSRKDKLWVVYAAASKVGVFDDTPTTEEVDERLNLLATAPSGTFQKLEGSLVAALRYRLWYETPAEELIDWDTGEVS